MILGSTSLHYNYSKVFPCLHLQNSKTSRLIPRPFGKEAANSHNHPWGLFAAFLISLENQEQKMLLLTRRKLFSFRFQYVFISEPWFICCLAREKKLLPREEIRSNENFYNVLIFSSFFRSSLIDNTSNLRSYTGGK